MRPDASFYVSTGIIPHMQIGVVGRAIGPY